MNSEEVEIGKTYRCDWEDGRQYFATVLQKNDQRVLVSVGNKVNADGDADDVAFSLGTVGHQWVDAKQLHDL
ncbi:MAG: hypothetical protein JOY67_09790 [Hyphomicrobiales bacterium]|nr:hypothetical protein [Hyphomicrobiales bacterium]MBV9519378.1 hypothetical protein [Hyphomicrobiales bacterium]